MSGRFNLWLVAIFLLAGISFWWLLLDNRHEGAAPHPLHMADLRRLAGQIPGAAPSAVEYELVAIHKEPGDFAAAGTGLKRRVLADVAFRLPVAGGKALVIDSGVDPDSAKDLGYMDYDSSAKIRVDTALGSAGTILVTQERREQVGELLALSGRPGNSALLSRARFNPAQLAQVSLLPDWHWPAGAPLVAGLTGRAPEPVAPGVVVIPTPGHTPGSQMIYARLADGREFLFVGGIAPLATNLSLLRSRSRLIGDFHEGENRAAAYAWLLTAHQLAAEAPNMIVVPGQDWKWLLDATAGHIMHQGFTPDPH